MFLYLVQQNIINGDRPVSAVENQRHSVVVEVDGPQENIHHPPAVVLVVDIPSFQRIEKRLDLRCGESDLFPHLNGKLALQFVFFLFALLNALGDHIHRLPALQGFPEVFYGGVRLLNCRLDALDEHIANLEDGIAVVLISETEYILASLKDRIDLEAYFSEIWPEIKKNNPTADKLFELFWDDFSGYMKPLASKYIAATDAELTVRAVSQRTTAWAKQWSKDLSGLMQLESHTQIEKILLHSH